jgi:two-component system response regulator YesN
MTYKVFLVEDEIATREGIRDAVDWAAAGYQFCGEAPDGEIALPLIRERRPETVITDIKMPFMDGLQLCRILRETLPCTKIIILSGHDEFRYAQEAIQIGVTEYLLKPVSPQDLVAALRKVARQIDEEHQASARIEALQAQMASHQPLLRERCLLDLVAGNTSPADFIEQARNLGIDLLAPWYQVMLVRAVLPPGVPETPLSAVCGQIDAVLAEIIGQTGSVIPFRQGLKETILILKGSTPDMLARQAQILSELIQRRVAERTGCLAMVGIGEATERLGTISLSFAQALAQLSAGERHKSAEAQAPAEYQQLAQRHAAALIAKACSYIETHYADPDISLSQVAAQVLLSPTYFSVVFGREVGETFIEYLTRVRIRKAIELLRSTSLTSSEIGYQIGYQNPRYFYSVFRKVVGQPPTEFRRGA